MALPGKTACLLVIAVCGNHAVRCQKYWPNHVVSKISGCEIFKGPGGRKHIGAHLLHGIPPSKHNVAFVNKPGEITDKSSPEKMK